MFVDDEFPMAMCGRRRAEVVKVERQYRQRVPFGERHDRGIGVSEPEVGELSIDRHGSFQQGRRDAHDSVLARGERFEKQPRCVVTHTRAQQLIDLDDHGLRHKQVPTELGNQCGGEAVGAIAVVGRGDQRAGVRDDPQRVSMRSER